jgi:hypothetical protein
MTKTITINNLECYPNLNGLENVVKNVAWTLVVEETINGNVETMTINGTTQLPAADQNAFTTFDNLTAEQVTGWVNANTDTDTLAKPVIVVSPTESTRPEVDNVVVLICTNVAGMLFAASAPVSNAPRRIGAPQVEFNIHPP